MPHLLRDSLLSVRDLLASAAPFIVLTAALLGVAYVVLDPTPPSKVVLATGPDQGAYSEFGKRYAAQLARFGVTVELRATAGASENLRLLRDPASGVDVAFTQTGAGEAIHAIDEDPDADRLTSLGNLFYEPVWLFYRTESAKRIVRDGTLTQLGQFMTMKVNIGARGSGAANLLDKLFFANRLEPQQLKLERLAPTPAVIALLDGTIDALAFVSAPESPLVRMLLQTPGIKLLNFPQAPAYARRFSFLEAVTLPRGVVDLSADIPPQEVQLVAAVASLVANDRLHPALAQLFVQAARVIHGTNSWFGPPGQFPNGTATSFPLNKEAERFYRSGTPLLQQYLPFWFANLIERMWVVLVGIIAVLIPASRIVPPLYEFRIRSRVFRWYRKLREIEVAAAKTDGDPTELLRELDALDKRVESINVPLSYADELYALRGHIELVRKHLEALIKTPGAETTAAA